MYQVQLGDGNAASVLEDEAQFEGRDSDGPQAVTVSRSLVCVVSIFACLHPTLALIV